MSGSELKANARVLIIRNAPRLFFVSLLYFLLVTATSWLSSLLPGTIDIYNMYDRLSSGEMFGITLIYRNFRPAGAVFAVLFRLLFQPVFDIGMMRYCIKIRRGESSDLKDILGGFKYYAKVIAIFTITSALILAWSLLLIVPGIVAAYRYRFAYYILIEDPSKGAFQCIEESVMLMHGIKPDLFVIDISFLGWYFLDFIFIALIPLPYTPRLLLIWLAPYRGITIAGFYENRKNMLAV